jgi:hypothetical protein
MSDSESGDRSGPASHIPTQEAILKLLQFHPDPIEHGRGKNAYPLQNPGGSHTHTSAEGFLNSFSFLPWKNDCVFPGSMLAGKFWLMEEGLRPALLTPPSNWCSSCSRRVVHLNALFQLPSQSSNLCHQVTQVTAQRDLVTGIQAESCKKREEESGSTDPKIFKHLRGHCSVTFLPARDHTVVLGTWVTYL